ncbi:MAG: hypothetical protein OEY97_11040 [Nitrospirota bacterium]|nr:hypothetical protein [Nitrospirota bacterium]
MSTWNDFNNADDQQSYDLIPKGTIAKVRMTIRPGGHDDPNEGWTGGYATRKAETGSVYLNAEFVVTEGPYARRKVWSLIGLHSPKGPEWAHMGRAFIKGILNSARGVHPNDDSPQSQNARRIGGLADLDGIEFIAKIDLEKDAKGDDKNAIKQAIAPDHKEYAAVMGAVQAPAPAPAAQATTGGRPSWAQ